MNSIESAVSFSTPYCFYSIVDIESAWRWIPVSPLTENYKVFAGRLAHTTLPSIIIMWTTDAIVRMMAHHGFHAVVNYLDDFLTRSTKEECQWGLVTRINLLHYLGFNASWRKVVSLTQRITFLGIELDSSTMSPRLPEDKFNRLIDLVNTFSLKPSASIRQLQSLTGSLNFACQVVHGGRTFLHHMIDYLNKLNHSSHRCPLSTDFLLIQRISHHV